MDRNTSTLNQGAFLLSDLDFKTGYELSTDSVGLFSLRYVASENLVDATKTKSTLPILGTDNNNDLLIHKSLVATGDNVSIGTLNTRINKSYFQENRSNLFVLDRISKSDQLSNRNNLTDSASYLYVDNDTDKLVYESVSGRIELTESGGASIANDDSLEEPVESMDLTYWAISYNEEDIITNFKVGIGVDDPNEIFTLDGAVSMKIQSGGCPVAATKGYGKLYVGDSGDLHFINGSGVDMNISEKISVEEDSGDGIALELNPWSHSFDQTKIYSWHDTSIGTDKTNGTLTVNGGIGIGQVESSPSISSEFGQIYAKKDGHLYYISTGGKEAMLTRNELGNEEYEFDDKGLNPFSLSYNQDKALIFNNPNHFIDYNGNIVCKELTQLSDESLKKNIESIEGPDCLDIISKLNPAQYQWRDDSSEAVGLIAQEVNKVAPNVVKNNEDGKQSINYSALTAYLIGAVKELQEEIKELKGHM